MTCFTFPNASRSINAVCRLEVDCDVDMHVTRIAVAATTFIETSRAPCSRSTTNHNHQSVMNAATRVFNIPELIELILLSLPCDTIHTEVASMRTMHVSRTTSRTWHSLLEDSSILRHRLYLSTSLDQHESRSWLDKSAFPPAEPNPWIVSHLLFTMAYSTCTDCTERL